MVGGVGQQGLVGVTVKPAIGLLVALDPVSENADRAGHRLLIKAGEPALVQGVHSPIGAVLGGGGDLDGEDVGHGGHRNNCQI